MNNRHVENLIRKASAASLAVLICVVLWNQIFTPLHLLSNDHSGVTPPSVQASSHSHEHDDAHHHHDDEPVSPTKENEHNDHHQSHAALDHQIVFTTFAFETTFSPDFAIHTPEEQSSLLISSVISSSEKHQIYPRGPPSLIS